MSPKSQANESLITPTGCFPGFAVAYAARHGFHAFVSSQLQFQSKFT